MCPQNCVLNLPKPREQQPDVGPAAMFVGNIVQGVRIAGAQGRELGFVHDEVFRDSIFCSNTSFLANLLDRYFETTRRADPRPFPIHIDQRKRHRS